MNRPASLEAAINAPMQHMRQETGVTELCSVNHLSTPEEVERFAIKGHHSELEQHIIMYRAHPEITWEQAMQLAAVELAKSLDRANTMLRECMNNLSQGKIPGG